MDTSLFPCLLFALENLRHLCGVGVINLFCKPRQEVFYLCLFPQVSHFHVLGQTKIHAKLDKVSDVHLVVTIAESFVKAVVTRDVAELYSSGNCEVTNCFAESYKDVSTTGYSGFFPHFVPFLPFLLLILKYQPTDVSVGEQSQKELFCQWHGAHQMDTANSIFHRVNLNSHDGIE